METLTIDYQKATSFCGICGLSQLNQVYVTSYNHMMQPSRRKCFHKRSHNFKVNTKSVLLWWKAVCSIRRYGND